MDWSDGRVIADLLQQLDDNRRPCRNPRCGSWRIDVSIHPINKVDVYAACFDCGAAYRVGRLREREEEIPVDQRREQLRALRRNGVDRRPGLPSMQRR